MEWTYTPENFFEERVELTTDGTVFEIENGRVIARLPDTPATLADSTRHRLHAELTARFLAAQLLADVPFKLLSPSVARVHDDGRRDAFVHAVVSIALRMNADTQVRDAAGNVISDSRRERINRRRRLADQGGKAADDPVAQTMLRSYSAAMNDPGNELVHLYEVRESLASSFGGESQARAVLGITKRDWSELGRLANIEPLSQGRHRGKNLGAIRDATAEELGKARALAKSMIEAYMRLKLGN